MRNWIVVLAAALVLVITSACTNESEQPIAAVPSQKNVPVISKLQRDVFEFEWTVSEAHPCTGELVVGTVKDSWTIKEHVKENGDRVITWHVVGKGTLIGQESGTKYQINDQLHVLDKNINWSCPMKTYFKMRRLITGPGGKNNFRLIIDQGYGYDCEWNLTFFSDVFNAECI